MAEPRRTGGGRGMGDGRTSSKALNKILYAKERKFVLRRIRICSFPGGYVKWHHTCTCFSLDFSQTLDSGCSKLG